MIFVTVGSQLPFDRLVKTVDEWAGVNKGIEIFAQIGLSDFKPQNIEFCKTMPPDEYNIYLTKAEFIVAHAGMGTIISALESGKKLLLIPRLASQGEHRNDHQLSTANRFSHFSIIEVAEDESELLAMMNKFVNQNKESVDSILTEVSVDLINKIKNFVNEE